MKLPRLRIGGNDGLPIIHENPGYPGIRLRVSTPSGVVLEVDSNELHYRAARRGPGWRDLIAGGDAGTTDFSTVPLKIEVLPVRLSDVPDA